MRDPLKDIYKNTFENYVVEVDDSGWQGLEKKLKFAHFAHFDWMRFNIYYAAAILVSFILTVTATGHYFYKEYSHTMQEDVVSLETKKKGSRIPSASLTAPIHDRKLPAIALSDSPEKPALGAKRTTQSYTEETAIDTIKQVPGTALVQTPDLKPKAVKDTLLLVKEVPYIARKSVLVEKRDTLYQVQKKNKLRLFKK